MSSLSLRAMADLPREWQAHASYAWFADAIADLPLDDIHSGVLRDERNAGKRFVLMRDRVQAALQVAMLPALGIKVN